jgi:hypothetical protein
MTELYAGLDVSLELTNICVVDGEGRLVHECRVGSDPEMIAAELKRIGDGFVRVGFEAGPLSQWMFFGLKQAGLPAVCIEAGARQGSHGRDEPQQERPQRCAVDRASNPLGLVQSGACEVGGKPGTALAAGG